MSDSTNAQSRRGFGYAALIAAALFGAIGGGFAGTALGHGGFGPRMMHWGGGGHWGGHGRGPIDPARAQEHAARMADHLAWAVDANDQQKQQLTVIATGMVKDLLPIHEKMHAARSRAVELLRAPKTDRAALEALRAEQIAVADQVSKRLAQGLADAADVLTPQQRTKLAAHWSF